MNTYLTVTRSRLLDSARTVAGVLRFPDVAESPVRPPRAPMPTEPLLVFATTLQLHVYVCLAILETCTDELMELDESEVLWYLRHLPSLDMSQVITHALNIKDDVAMAGYRDEDCLGAKTL